LNTVIRPAWLLY